MLLLPSSGVLRTTTLQHQAFHVRNFLCRDHKLTSSIWKQHQGTRATWQFATATCDMFLCMFTNVAYVCVCNSWRLVFVYIAHAHSYCCACRDQQLTSLTHNKVSYGLQNGALAGGSSATDNWYMPYILQHFILRLYLFPFPMHNTRTIGFIWKIVVVVVVVDVKGNK